MKRSPMKRSSLLARRSRLKAGRKVAEWASARRKLKKIFEAAGITSCELRFDGCRRDDWLGFAHAKKRRKLREDELSTVILACAVCHDRIEVMRPEHMEMIVMETIAERGRP